MEQRSIRTNPIETIFLIETYREPNTMAFGGVETGNMNAQDDAIVAGSISIRAEIFVWDAKVANTGKKVAATAVLDVNSVSSAMDREITSKSSGKGRSLRMVRFWAI